MSKKLCFFNFFLLIICFTIFIHNSSWAMDTDLYAVTGLEVPPNVLIILDNSSSMMTQDQPPDYNPNKPASPPDYEGPYVKNGIYSKQGSDWVFTGKYITDDICSQAKSSLTIDGLYNGKVKSDLSCGGSKTAYLQTGNYMNYLVWTTTSNQPRLGLGKGTLHSYVNSTEGIRFGLMVFNANGQGGRVTAPVSDDKNSVFNALNDIQPSNVVDWTPLAETLYEAMLHFKGGPSYYNPGTSYVSPIQVRCQKNYVILITDGAPTHDVNDDPQSPIKKKYQDFPFVGDYDKDDKEKGDYGDPLLQGSHYLDDVARYIHLNDLRDDLEGRQNVTVYTIGFNPSFFAIDSTLLQSTADPNHGGGKYFYCHNAQSFKIAFQLIIEEILNKSTSFLAPTVPISQMEKTASQNLLYLGMFKPTERSFWKGNIKKFGIAASTDCKDLSGTRFVDKCTDCKIENNIKSCFDTQRGERVECSVIIGDIIDVNGDLAIDPRTNEIYDTAISYWGTVQDGSDVENGGVGSFLQSPTFNLTNRKIYTYLGANVNLTDSSNRFSITNTNVTPSLLALSTEDDKNKLVSFLHGYDAYDENGNSNTTEKRGWILGAFIHSRPLILHYEGRSVIYAGANDGMFHAFDADSGMELWAFIPPDLLPKLKKLTGNTIEFFIDGSPKAYIGADGKKIIVCGERRGGNHYFAVDVTDPLNPKWLWEIHPGLSDYGEMGQTWATPLMGKIKSGADDKWAIFIGGGYGESIGATNLTNQDDLPVTKNDTKGRAIYVVDVLTGARIWKYSIADNSQMKYSIPTDVTKVDTDGDGRIDRLYAGDMGGQMWRFDIKDPSPTNWTGKRIFNSNDPPPTSGVDRRKIFYSPDVSLEKDSLGDYELLIFGTGDREHPKSTTVVDRLYTIKDRNPGTVLKESPDLIDVTEDLLQDSSTTDTQKQTILNNLKTGSGWYIQLNQNSGEKCLSPSLIFYGISYFSTFTPLIDAISDPCFVGEGIARIYALNYLNGNAVFNFDLTNDGSTETLGRSDRASIIGTAIPSGAIIAVIGGNTATGYIGVGGGIYKTPLKSSNVIIPIHWRQKF
ncbi:MAG: hypothetical protein A2157_05485 [Deltaproteobacteria bacterium RBG_16_47_11]|nr:MAG: hypothetical protein A2157_05485 [Deltaproteobacteria bacterium RBG_16_47_11]